MELRGTIKLDDGYYAEYVHILSSACKVGDRVRKGDIIGATGAVGFCPEPHLHLEVHASAAKDAPSVPLRFRGEWGGADPGRGGWGRVRGGLVRRRPSFFVSCGFDLLREVRARRLRW